MSFRKSYLVMPMRWSMNDDRPIHCAEGIPTSPWKLVPESVMIARGTPSHWHHDDRSMDTTVSDAIFLINDAVRKGVSASVTIKHGCALSRLRG